jgi:hypothetical protein
MTEGTRKRMTLLEQATVTQWMTDNAECIPAYNADDLAFAVAQATDIKLTPSAAVRHRKGCGLAPEKPPKKERRPRVGVDSRLVAIEERLGAIEELLLAKKQLRK